ncbi:hypothetical protein T01_10339 [Trichinella spiralis]|uniref:Uncharacterized protein n=1 Tax=Trichinella spiralis TaxID=6334 RepID=A0A0V1AM68_TRISP|nr:hypothetical protein T01_10339 [Trichinella spiralis]
MNDERIVQQMYITYEEKCMPTGHSSCIYFRKELGWIVLPNLPYSPPDTALTDYYLFWSLSSVLYPGPGGPALAGTAYPAKNPAHCTAATEQAGNDDRGIAIYTGDRGPSPRFVSGWPDIALPAGSSYVSLGENTKRGQNSGCTVPDQMDVN